MVPRQNGYINVEALREGLRNATLYAKSMDYLSERNDL